MMTIPLWMNVVMAQARRIRIFAAKFPAATILVAGGTVLFLLGIAAQATAAEPEQPTTKAVSPRVAAAHVDQLLGEELFTAEVELAPLADDATFLRRIELDLVGQIPSVATVKAFLAATSGDKRQRMVSALLDDKRFGDHCAHYWCDVVLYRKIEDSAQRVQQPAIEYLSDAFNDGKGWDKIAKEMITATGRVAENGQTLLVVAQNAQTEELTAEVARIFLGVQIQCAQCHDHPTDRWTREQFHELAAFFPRVALRPEDPGDQTSLAVLVDDQARGRQRPNAANGRRGSPEHIMPDQYDPSQPGTVMRPEFFLTGDWLPTGSRDIVRRNAAADWIVDSEWFAKAYVNRIWSELVGEGFYNPVDDLGPDRKGVALETLGYLADGFVASGYNAKWLVETIVSTDAYARESRPRRASGEVRFTANIAQPLRPDVLASVLTTALGSESDRVGGSRGARDAMAGPVRAHGGLPGQLSDAFGYDPSNPRDEVDATIPQALLLMNNPQLNRQLQAQGGVVQNALQHRRSRRGSSRSARFETIRRTKWAQRTGRGAAQRLGQRAGGRQGRRRGAAAQIANQIDPQSIEDLYLRVLSRPPRQSELDIFRQYLAETGDPREA